MFTGAIINIIIMASTLTNSFAVIIIINIVNIITIVVIKVINVLLVSLPSPPPGKESVSAGSLF